jgi:transposase
VVFGLLERDGCVYTKVVESVSSEELMQRIQSKTRKGPVYFTEAFRGYQFLKRYGNPHTVNHTNSLVDHRNKNHFNGIEGFWSDAKHILYHYRGVSKYHFPMYLKEITYGVNHRTPENLCRRFLTISLGYVSP